MKNFLKIFSSENLKNNLKNISERFPISIIIIFLVAWLFFVELHYGDEISNLLSWKIFIAILSLIMTFFFSISTYLSTENSSFSFVKRNLFQLIPIIFWIIFYNVFYIDKNDFENFLFFFLTFAWIISYLFFAPYLKNIILPLLWRRGLGWGPKQSVFYTYFYNISTTILISFIFAWVLFWLGAIGIATTDALFDLDIDEAKTYWNWAILSLSIVAPIFALTQIPDKKSFLENHFNENAFFSFLIKFVVTPFIYLYFFILYAYTIKVLSNFSDWPKWIISWLVIWFSIFGYLAYIFSYIFTTPSKSPPYQGETSKIDFIKSFRKIFPYAVIPQVFMLFYAIYLRINQYDLTINRYFVVIFGIWLLIISLYFIFSKKKKLIFIPASLALFIIIISIIPKYNVYSYPQERQLNRLKQNLIKASILKVEKHWTKWLNTITPLKNHLDISPNLSKNIYSEIEYLCNFNNCEDIKNLFPKIYNEIKIEDKKNWEKRIKTEIQKLEKNKHKKECEYNKHWYKIWINCFDKKRYEDLKKEKYKWLAAWTIINWITKKIKVKKYYGWYFKSWIDEIKIYWSYYWIFPLNVKWYSEIIVAWTNHSESFKNKKYFQINIKEQNMYYFENWKKIETIDLKNLFKQIKKRYEKNKIFQKKDFIFKINEKYTIVFENIHIPKNFDDVKKIDDFYYYNTRWFVLVK